MSVKIYNAPESSGKGMKVAMGALTGGWAGAGKELLAANNPAIGKALGAYDAISGRMEKTKPQELTASNPVVDETPMKPDDAINRRINTLGADHRTTMIAGLNALNDPSVPPYLREAAVEPLLRAKHYGGMGLV